MKSSNTIINKYDEIDMFECLLKKQKMKGSIKGYFYVVFLNKKHKIKLLFRRIMSRL